MTTDIQLMEMLMMWCTTFIFTGWAIERESIIPNALSTWMWFIDAIMLFMADPLGTGPWLAWLFGAIGVGFALNLLYILGKGLTERRNARYEVPGCPF